MKKEVTFHVLKGGHSMGTWNGVPVKAKSKTVDEVQNNEEEPMIPPVLEDITPDVSGSVTASKDKKVTKDEDEDKLMPTGF